MEELTNILISVLAQFPIALVLFWVVRTERERSKHLLDRLDRDYLRLVADYTITRDRLFSNYGLQNKLIARKFLNETPTLSGS